MNAEAEFTRDLTCRERVVELVGRLRSARQHLRRIPNQPHLEERQAHWVFCTIFVASVAERFELDESGADVVWLRDNRERRQALCHSLEKTKLRYSVRLQPAFPIDLDLDAMLDKGEVPENIDEIAKKAHQTATFGFNVELERRTMAGARAGRSVPELPEEPCHPEVIEGFESAIQYLAVKCIKTAAIVKRDCRWCSGDPVPDFQVSQCPKYLGRNSPRFAFPNA